MLELRDVRVTFPEAAAPAVDDVTLTVAKAEVVAVLGPSGSGKSTLLRVAAGLQRPDTGAVLIDDVDVTGTPPHERGVGLMFQAPTLFPHRDVAANVGFALRMQKRPRAEIDARVAELLALVGLPEAGARDVATLSGGEQQRVALARTLAARPRVLLLDEPFGSLDAVLRARLVDDVGRLVRDLGLTVLAVTHDREEAYALADRVVVVRDGAVVADGTPEQLWSAPGSAWVARFLGMPNVLTAHLDRGLARTPWGVLVVDPSESGSTVVVPPRAVRLEPAATAVTGGESATVVARVFLGDRVRVTVRSAGGDELVATVEPAAAPAVGDEVAVTVEPGPDPVLVLP